jgi:hypothetical protein
MTEDAEIKRLVGGGQGSRPNGKRPKAGCMCRVAGQFERSEKGLVVSRVKSPSRKSGEEAMPKKPTTDDAKLILKLYDLRREAELRKARQWWLITFWPKSADDFVKVATAMGSEENNWLRQVGSYWGIAVSFVLNGVVSEKLFFQVSFCGEVYFIFAKVRPFLPEIREKMKNPELFLNIEKAILGSKIAREQFAKVEARVTAMRQQK